jgi:long-chain acyl-CoA synthetase
VALSTLNPEELAKFAAAQGLPTVDETALCAHPKVQERVSRIVEERNGELPSYAKVKKFTILASDFTVENGLLTPTLKVKRKVIREKYQSAIDQLYR